MSSGYGGFVESGGKGAEAARPQATRERPLTVGELVRWAHGALERTLGLVWVEGEVAQTSKPASGHLYFTLRDRNAVVTAVMWARDTARLKFAIESGQRLRVRGRLGVYDRDGKMQLYVDFAEPAGVGAAAVALDQLKRKLSAEGLFAAQRKRPLPLVPRRIGVVTSKSGAAVRDIIQTIQRRFPVPILIADCAVQGPSAPRQIVHALGLIVRADVEVVIVGRGGGSATDLSAFNDERVVRAVAACPVPVVSAVGHEIDLTLCDLAADRRASTPTAAAELCVPVLAELAAALAKEERRLGREVELRLARDRQELDRLIERAQRRVERGLGQAREALVRLERRRDEQHPRARLLARRKELAALVARLSACQPSPRLARARDAVVQLERRADAAIARRRHEAGAELGRLGAQLAALSPLAVLDRGYAVLRHAGAVVRDASALAPGDVVDAKVARGSLALRVERVEPDEGGA
jgi:exodeoxyribonuclease VII large subunit